MFGEGAGTRKKNQIGTWIAVTRESPFKRQKKSTFQSVMRALSTVWFKSSGGGSSRQAATNERGQNSLVGVRCQS